MGWSELTAAPDIDRIFKKQKLKYTVRRVLQVHSPIIQILHEGKLPIPIINQILELFPEFVYVEFVPDTPFNPSEEGDSFTPVEE